MVSAAQKQPGVLRDHRHPEPRHALAAATEFGHSRLKNRRAPKPRSVCSSASPRVSRPSNCIFDSCSYCGQAAAGSGAQVALRWRWSSVGRGWPAGTGFGHRSRSSDFRRFVGAERASRSDEARVLRRSASTWCPSRPQRPPRKLAGSSSAIARAILRTWAWSSSVSSPSPNQPTSVSSPSAGCGSPDIQSQRNTRSR